MKEKLIKEKEMYNKMSAKDKAIFNKLARESNEFRDLVGYGNIKRNVFNSSNFTDLEIERRSDPLYKVVFL